MVAFVGLFSILLTATRGWIIASSILLLGTFFLFGLSRSITKLFRLVIVSVFGFWVVVSQFPVLKPQVDASFERLATIEALAAGDITAGGTLGRLNVRSPKVMKKFWESPVFGWGFSNEYFDNHDQHVGHQNILLNIGVLGYVFIMGLFISIWIKTWRLSRRKEIRRYEGNAPLVYLFSLIAVFVIHSSSTQLWGYHLGKEKTLFLAFLLAAINAVQLFRKSSVK